MAKTRAPLVHIEQGTCVFCKRGQRSGFAAEDAPETMICHPCVSRLRYEDDKHTRAWFEQYDAEHPEQAAHAA